MTKADYREASRFARKLARRAEQRRKAMDRVSVSLATFYSADTLEALAREHAPRALSEALNGQVL